MKKIFRKIISIFKPKQNTSIKVPINTIEIQKEIDLIIEGHISKCPNLLKFNSEIRFWKAVIKAICYAESSFNPFSTFWEKDLGNNGYDKVTGAKYLSEGLMQLSYSDHKYYQCEFDWELDKNKKENDPTKSIFNTKKNIECGMIILDKLVSRHGKFIFNSGNYLAVLKPTNKRHSEYLKAFNLFYSKKEEILMNESNMPWIDLAKNELNISEVPGSNHNQRILEYHAETGLKASDDETPWCSSFVTWCLEKSGFKSTKNAWARSYLNYGKKLDKPVEGCIVILSRGKSSGHVGFYMGESMLNIKVLGGNQGNKVCIAEYPKMRVLGYRMPLERKS